AQSISTNARLWPVDYHEIHNTARTAYSTLPGGTLPAQGTPGLWAGVCSVRRDLVPRRLADVVAVGGGTGKAQVGKPAFLGARITAERLRYRVTADATN